jgi:hypothetical protein
MIKKAPQQALELPPIGDRQPIEALPEHGADEPRRRRALAMLSLAKKVAVGREGRIGPGICRRYHRD